MYLDHIKARVNQSKLPQLQKTFPCSEQEVKKLEQQFGKPLPGAYREFLLWMGRGGTLLLRGTDCWYSNLLDLQSWARELLEENAFPQPLPTDAFVFYMHQGYQFGFFHACTGNDPAVYYYIEGSEQTDFVQLSPSFSAFLEAEVNGHIEFWRVTKLGR
jgi:hypothetical protein